jgi:uncharacterized membrane protein
MSLETDKNLIEDRAGKNDSARTDLVTSGQAPVASPEFGEASEPLAPVTKRSLSTDMARRAQVRVPENLSDIIAGIPITPEEAEALRRRRLLNVYIHKLLTVGLAASTAAMLAGIVLDLADHADEPSLVPHFTEVLQRILALQPSGFLALGLIILILTPILRVAGSFIAFLYERDWRFAGLTFLVLVILALSVMFGRG